VRLNGIEGRVALVTGAGRGIGRCIAETLRDQGARTAAGDLETPTVPDVFGVALDVSDEQSVERAFDEIERELGIVELLVLNAGIMVSQPFPEVTVDVWSRQLEVNLTGAFLCARRALPGMVGAGSGSIVAVGSSAGKTGGGVAAAAYSASKAGLMGLTRELASQWGRYEIRVNAVAPGFFASEMTAELGPDADSFPDWLTAQTPLQRGGRPGELDEAILFLLGGASSFVTGHVLTVDGGLAVR